MNFPFFNNLTFSEASERYFAKLEANALLSKKSIEKYREISNGLLSLLGDVKIKKFDGDTVMNLKQKLNLMKSEKTGCPLSASRKNHYLVVLKNILQCLRDDGIKIYNPNLIKKFKIPAKQIIHLNKKQLQELIDSISEENISRLRLKTAVICLISSACRVSELIRLDISDIDFKNGKAQVLAKGGKMHTLIFNELAIGYIEKYLAMRIDNNPALFVTANTDSPKRWQINDLERALRNQGKRAGFQISIHPHLLRRSSASLLFHQKASLSVVQRFLGHATPSVTERYYLGNTSFSEVERVHKEIMGGFNIENEPGKEVAQK